MINIIVRVAFVKHQDRGPTLMRFWIRTVAMLVALLARPDGRADRRAA
jgi:hypothetical protein